MQSSDYTVKVRGTSHNVTTNIVSVQHSLTDLGGCLLVTWIVTLPLYNILRAFTRNVSKYVSYAYSIFPKTRTYANVFYFSVRVSSSYAV